MRKKKREMTAKEEGRAKFNELVEPISKFAKEHRGFVAEVCRRMKVHRNVVDHWIHADESKRVQPLLGTGTVFLFVAEEVRREMII